MEQRSVRVLDSEFQFEWGRIGRQANGAVLAREGETVVMAAVVAAEEPRPDGDFFPLTVEYRERFSAAGRFPGGYRKREGAASEHEILTSRLIDRSIRPLFPESYRCEVQVLVTVLACAPDGDPPILGILAAAAALQISDIPWNGPVASIRLGRAPEGGWIAYPRPAEREISDLDLVLSFAPDGLVMAEGGAKEISEEDLMTGLLHAEEKIHLLIGALAEIRKAGKAKREVAEHAADAAIGEAVRREAGELMAQVARTPEKQERNALLGSAREKARESVAIDFPDAAAAVSREIESLAYRTFRSTILDTGHRADGRTSTEIRPIQCEVGWLPRVHGSALFTRGETQAMAVCTLGTGRDEQEIEGLAGVRREAFHLFYRFPSYSVGEVRPLRGPGRREIGHGHLARRALAAVLPSPEVFPYTIKLESEITSSNGSSSMATVCGGCLALMDAGVPIARPVAGIAMGLIREEGRVAILSDILGDEDHLGDMDFKIAGTEAGITVVQLDNKIGSLPLDLMRGALAQARDGRLHILGKMHAALAKPRSDLSPHAPRVGTTRIGVHRIRDLIGPGGRVIQDLQADTGSKIDVADDGLVRVYAPDMASLQQTMRRVRDLTDEPEVGRIYRGVVTGVKEFGVFVRIFQGIEGLVHATELAAGPVRDTAQVASEGDEMIVKVLGIDGQGKIKLSRKQAIGAPESEIANA